METTSLLAFASDFDNTLFHHDGTGIHDEDALQIRTFQAEGGLFGLCTGRCLSSMLQEFRPLLEEKGIRPDFWICSSGAVLADREGRVLVSHPLEPEVLQAVRDRAPAVPLVIHSDKPHFCVGESWKLFPLLDQIPADLCLYGFTAWNTPALRPDTEGLPVEAHVNDATVDFTAAGVCKGTGIRDLCQMFGLDPDQVGRIGDSWNDISFLQGAVYGFTFYSSPIRVRNVTAKTVHSVAEAICIMTKNERFQTKKVRIHRGTDH